MKIYGDERSGNCYKLKLACALLDIPHQWVPVDILAAETRAPGFLAMNPNGKIPLLELEDGRYLAESNAILNYLVRGSRLEPEDAFAQAQVQQWQFFEQYSHEPYIAVARYIALYLGLPEERAAEYRQKQEGGHRALKVMEQALSKASFLVAEHLSAADIALYAYTHVAHEGGFDLEPYPAVRRWLERVAAEPRYVAMRD